MVGEVDQLIALQQLINSLSGGNIQAPGTPLNNVDQAAALRNGASLIPNAINRAMPGQVSIMDNPLGDVEAAAAQRNSASLGSILQSLAAASSGGAIPSLAQTPTSAPVSIPREPSVKFASRNRPEERRGGFAVSSRDSGYLDYR